MISTYNVLTKLYKIRILTYITLLPASKTDYFFNLLLLTVLLFIKIDPETPNIFCFSINLRICHPRRVEKFTLSVYLIGTIFIYYGRHSIYITIYNPVFTLELLHSDYS